MWILRIWRRLHTLLSLALARLRSAAIGMNLLEIKERGSISPGKILEFIRKTRVIISLAGVN